MTDKLLSADKVNDLLKELRLDESELFNPFRNGWNDALRHFAVHIFEGKLDTNQWVSVEDRLPEIDEETLIRMPVCNHFNIEDGKYMGHGQWVGAWCDRRGRDCTYQVTHWMPLPQPPESE